MRLEARVGDELVWECDSVYLSRGGGNPRSGAGGGLARPRPRARRSRGGACPRTSGASYAAVSGDVNPIHLYPLSARAMGFPRQIAHGMWTSARTLAALGRGSLGPSTSRVWFTRAGLPAEHAWSSSWTQDPGAARWRRSGRRREPAKTHLVLTLDA